MYKQCIKCDRPYKIDCTGCDKNVHENWFIWFNNMYKEIDGKKYNQPKQRQASKIIKEYVNGELVKETIEYSPATQG